MNPEIINEHPSLKNFKLTQYIISPDPITTENDQIINKIKYEELDPIDLLNNEPRDSPIEKDMDEMDEHLIEASDKLNEEIQAGIIQVKEMNSSESLNEKVKNGGQTKFSGKKRCRNEEANKNSTKNRTKYNINKIHKSKKEGKPKVDLLDEESEISSILGEKEKYNIDDLSIANGEFNNFSSGNDLNLKLISSEFNNNFYSSKFKFNFENAFLKENFNQFI